MVVRRVAGAGAGEVLALEKQGREMPMRGREIAGTVGGAVTVLPAAEQTCRMPLGTLKPAGFFTQQVLKKRKGGATPSPAELRLIEKYMHEARSSEDGVDEAALRKLVKSKSFKKFVHRHELENEVVELHEQLEKEVELHSSLQSALSHSELSTLLPDSGLHDLPTSVQRLLTDIAMLEATVLRLETQASALQWDIAHERTERESIEHTLNAPLDANLQPRFSKLVLPAPPQSPQLLKLTVPSSPKLAPASPPRLLQLPKLVPSLPQLAPASPPRAGQLPRLVPSSPQFAPASPPKAPRLRARSTSPAKAPTSPTVTALKEILHTPAPRPQPEPDHFEICTPPKSPKSPRQSLRSPWSALDGSRAQASLPPILEKLNSKDRARIQQSWFPDAATCFPSATGILPANLHLSSSLSPFTHGEQPRTTTPVTPASWQPEASPRKFLNPARLLVSTKRLAFWNFSSSSDDAASLNNRAANPTPEIEQQPRSGPVQYSDDCSSLRDEDFTDDIRLRKLRGSRGMKRQDQSPPRDSSYSVCSTRSDVSFATSEPRKSIKDSPRPSTAECKDYEFSQSLFAELPSDANSVSEEMVRCMVDIYCHLAEPSSESHASQECPLSPSSHTGRLSRSSSLSSSHSDSSLPFGARSPEVDPGQYGALMGCETTADPYKAMGKLPWADIGPYSEAYEVPWLSVGKNQLEYVAYSLGKFRLLVERLAKVDPSAMTHEQKLAFWINLYNALLMHAFLAYGIPRSDLKFFTLMQKAAYCVGGHWFNAAAIECTLLKAKIMLHRPQFALIMALHSKKLTEEQSQFGIDKPEPKVNFALSCGGHSSPMVRVYTSAHIHDELDSAFEDYLLATVGVTAKGRVLLPKLIYNYAREFAEDDVVLEWVCRFLPFAQVAVIYECVQQRHRRRLFNSAPFAVAPYSFAFRYLFPRSMSGAALLAGDLHLNDFAAASEKKRHQFCT